MNMKLFGAAVFALATLLVNPTWAQETASQARGA